MPEGGSLKRQVSSYYVNGQTYELTVEPHKTLLELLREDLGLTGAKYGCGTADCGACTVLVDGRPTLSCSTLAVTVRGKQIVTIEGLAEDGVLHPIQAAFVNQGAIQCGYCSPGMILTTKALMDENPRPTAQEVREALAGNLCRCTGYVKIVEAALSAAESMAEGGR